MTLAVPPRPTLAILIGLAAIGPLAQSILIPSLPGLQRVFETDYATVQYLLTLSLLGIALAQLVYGPVSDRYGRRPVLLVGGLIFLAGSVACIFAPDIETLIALRLVQAVGGCAGIVLVSAVLRDLYERERVASMLAYVTMGMVVAPMIAPTIGGILEEWIGWWANFVFVGIMGAIILGFALSTFHETNHARLPLANPLDISRAFGRLLAVPAFLSYAVVNAFSLAMFFGFLAGAPYVMIELMGRSPSEYGLYFMLVSGAFMAGNFISARVSPRFGIDRMIWAGTSLTLLGMMALFVVAALDRLTPGLLFGLPTLMALGNGLTMANGMAGAVSVNPRAAGTAAGLVGFMQMFLAAVASFIVGVLIDDSAMPLVSVMLISASLAFVAHALGGVARGRSRRQGAKAPLHRPSRRRRAIGVAHRWSRARPAVGSRR